MATAGAGSSRDIRLDILRAVAASPEGVADTMAFAASTGADHLAVVGATKSLQAKGMVLPAPHVREQLVLTAEALGYAKSGSPEVQVLNTLPVDGSGITGNRSAGQGGHGSAACANFHAAVCGTVCP